MFLRRFLSNSLATVFMLLNLNSFMSVIFNVPAAVASTVSHFYYFVSVVRCNGSFRIVLVCIVPLFMSVAVPSVDCSIARRPTPKQFRSSTTRAFVRAKVIS